MMRWRLETQAKDQDMLRPLIGTLTMTILARQLGGVAAGPAGAILGLALPFAARRLGPLGMLGMAVGAWTIKRVLEDQAKKEAAAAANDVTINAKAEQVV